MPNAFYQTHTTTPVDPGELADDLPFDFAHPALVRVTITPAMIDLFGHANHSLYHQWWAEAAWAHSRRDGLTEAATAQAQAGMAVIRAETDYLAHGREGDTLIIAVWITQCDGKLRAERRFQAIRLSDHRVIARARWELVCFDLVSGKPRRMPPSFRAHYRPASLT